MLFASRNHCLFWEDMKTELLENEFSGNLVEVCPTAFFLIKH